MSRRSMRVWFVGVGVWLGVDSHQFSEKELKLAVKEIYGYLKWSLGYPLP
jgi:hypothetical protein